MCTKATMVEPLPILTRRSDLTPTMLSPFAIEEQRNGISTTQAVMRISRWRGSWILQFAGETRTWLREWRDPPDLCPLLAQSGHPNTLNRCPLLGVKRTLNGHAQECAPVA